MTDVTAAPATPATAPAAAPESVLAAPASQNTIPVQQGAAWHASFDQDTIGWLENKGLSKLEPKDALSEAVRGFRNAEKFVGVPAERLAKIPDFVKADQGEIDAFYTKLGRPQTAEAYEMPVPEGVPADSADWAKQVFHKAGLTASQAKEINAAHNAHQEKLVQAYEAEYQEKLILENKELRKEWGEGYDQQVKMAKSVIDQLQIKPEEIDAMERHLGFSKIMKLMSSIGSKIGEDMFVSSTNTKGFSDVLTPAAATARIAHLKSDKEFVLKYTGGNPDAIAEMNRLHLLAGS